MWFLLFPDWIYHLILLLGVVTTLVGFTLGFIPAIKKYILPIQLFGILILVVGVYLEGAQSTHKAYKEKISDLEVKIAQAEAKAQKVNTVIVTKVITKREVVKERGDSVVEYIDREVVKSDDKCTIPSSAIVAHNAAAQNKNIDEVLTPNSSLKTDDHNRAAQSPSSKIILPKK